MPFRETSRMQNRKLLVSMVLSGEATISQAARLFEVSRPTAYLWVKRAKEQGVAPLQEESRRPHHIARTTDIEVEAMIVAHKEARPAWGAKKLHALLWPKKEEAPVCVRTVDRILARHAMVGKRNAAALALQRFEREACNLLWQMDFKGMGKKPLWMPLSVMDDRSRFCLALSPLKSTATRAVWGVLWEVFGEYGLPEYILTDNGDCFNSIRSLGPTPLQAKLWRLGVKTTHGRPAHPQTQGKVERFHRTLEAEYHELLYTQSEDQVKAAWEKLREDYNWTRPHEALEMEPPGHHYRPSDRKRPQELPPPFVPDGALLRKVDDYGKFTFRSQKYRAGRGLAGEWVYLQEAETS